MANSSTDLHVVFLPFLSPGHMIPMVDMAKIVSRICGVTATIVTTTGNACRIRPALTEEHDGIALLTIPFTSSTAPENATGLPTPELTIEFINALDGLERPFEKLMHGLSRSPDCIVADGLLPWSIDVASRLGIPRVAFCASGSFPNVLMGMVGHARPHDGQGQQQFLVPGLPHEIRMTRSQLPTDFLLKPGEDDYWTEFMARVADATPRSYGLVSNSFYEMESEYCDMFRTFVAPKKFWNVGPVSQWNLNQPQQDCTSDDCLRWLERKKPGSVIYVCFGSLGQFTAAQLQEMTLGLKSCAHPFVWVVRDIDGGDNELEWMPEGCKERFVDTGKGLIIRGWAPQLAILGHRAVGGFVTHCGWNSTLEGVTAGVPMATWPLMCDQFFNERLILDVLRIGVYVGSSSSSFRKEERTLVRGEQLQAAVDELMGEHEEAKERRQRAERLAVMAKGAVVEGGSSSMDMTDMIHELAVNAKMARGKGGLGER